MLNVRSILFPTDGSACAEFAHAHADFLAQQFDAALHILHVVEDQMEMLKELAELVEISESDILEQLRLPVPEDVEQPATADEHIHRVKQAHPSAGEGVLDYAEEYDIDLIVMGTHGRRGVDRLLMGSVAEEIVRLSECPTLTVCGKKLPEPSRDINHILVPMGLSKHTDMLFAHARAIAATYDAQLDLLHVIEQSALPSVYQVDDVSTADAVVEERVRESLDAYAQKAAAAGVEASVTVQHGYPAAVILDRITDVSVDLVTIATHGRTGLKRLLMGSVAEKVVRMATCPVFTVKSFGKSLVASEARNKSTSA